MDNEEEIAGARRISTIEGSAYGVSEGFGIRNITPYALALGAKPMHISLLSSLPNLIGGLFQIYTIKAMFKHSRRNIVFWSVLAQALLWLAIIGVGVLFFTFGIDSGITPVLLIITYTALVGAGAVAGPAWSAWMGDLVQEDNKGRYFGMRNTICGATSLIFALIGAFILDHYKVINLFAGFIILFAFSFIFRSVSASLFRKQYEPQFKPSKEYYFTFRQFLKKMPFNNFGRFVMYDSLVLLVTMISSPFLAVYMLQYLHFSYVTFMAVTLASMLSTLIFMPLWGRFSDKYGNMITMRMCGFFLMASPTCWFASAFIFSPTSPLLPVFLACAEAFSGFAWAGYNLSTTNFVYDAVTKHRLAICFAYNSIIVNATSFVGAIIGGVIASLSGPIIGLTPILFVFLIGGASRFLVTLFMSPRIREVREVKRLGIKNIIFLGQTA